jgi:transcriptional regulator with XRE-family HTH domain
MSVKSPESADVQVGSRIKLQRQKSQLSQRALAEHLGVTFQQVQKYEKGVTRIGASRLTQIADALGVSVVELLGDVGAQENTRPTSPQSPMTLLTIPGAPKLLKAFAKISDGQQRRNIVAVVERIASERGKFRRGKRA